MNNAWWMLRLSHGTSAEARHVFLMLLTASHDCCVENSWGKSWGTGWVRKFLEASESDLELLRGAAEVKMCQYRGKMAPIIQCGLKFQRVSTIFRLVFDVLSSEQ